MKKYSAEFFEKKYRILFNKLLTKNGFISAVKATRVELGIPENGFNGETDLAIYLISKMSAEEQQLLSFTSFADDYHRKNHLPIDDRNTEKAFDAYLKEDREEQNVKMIFWLGQNLMDHNYMLSKNDFYKNNKFLSGLFLITFKLIRRFWGLDLLDEHIMGHFVEKYLFLGEYGINQYIKHKVACPNCRYIGVHHFSPTRDSMRGQDKGPYSKGYVFNKHTVKLLSLHFNSVFLIIKPYATKEETLQYIEDNWNNLKEHIIEKNTFYKQFDVHPSKIKESDFERNQLIYELHKLSKKELLKRYTGEKDFAGSGIYKEAIISAMLQEQYKIGMSPDAIKKAATRFAKETKVKRQLKDIGDI